MMHLLLLLALSLTPWMSNEANQAVTSSASSGEVTFRSSTHLVLVDVTALDAAAGAPATNFKRGDFQVFDNGRLVPIRTFDSGLQSLPFVMWFVVQCPMRGWEAKGSGLFADRAQLFAPALQHLNRADRVGVAHWCDDGSSQIDVMPTRDAGQVAPGLERVLTAAVPADAHGRAGELALQKTLRSIIDTTSALPDRAIPVIVFLYGDWSGMPKSEANGFVDALLSQPRLYLESKILNLHR